MGIRLDGTGYLIHTGKILSALPLTIIAFGTRTVTSGDQCWVSHSQSAGDRYVRMYLIGSSEYKAGAHRSPVQSSLTRKVATPNASATVARMFSLEVTSPTSRTVRFGDSLNAATNTEASGTPSDDIVSHDQVIIGASQYNSFAFDKFTVGDLMEVHFIAGTVSTADYDAMLAGTLMPEDITGWVDGLPLKDFEASGTYTSIMGRTFTAVGGVTATPGTVAHPIARASPAAATIAWTEGADTIAAAVDVTITGVAIAAAWTEGADVIAMAGTASGASVGTITTPPLKNNTGFVWANEAGVVANVYNATTGALVVRKTGLTSSALGVVTISDALIVAGTSYSYEIVLAANGRRLPVALAA